MRFLYGDSEPFPLAFDFLDALRLLLRHGSEAARALHRADAESAAMRARVVETKEALTHLVRFTGEVEASIETVALTAEHPEAQALGESLLAFTRRSVQERAEVLKAELKRANAASADHAATAMELAREELRTFLLHHELGARLEHLKLVLRDGRYVVSLRHRLGDLSVGFDVAPKGLPAWQEPRRLGSIAEDLNQLQVGMKKKLFRRDLTREMMRVADHYVLSATVETRRATVEIAKKLDGSKPPLLLELELEEDGIYAHIERTSSEGASLFPAVPSDVEKLGGLFAVLQRVARDAHAQRIGVCCADLGDVDLISEDPGALLEYLVARWAPDVVEIARRSPTPRELSLKVEHEDGRREERYLDRQLVDALLDDLPPPARARLVPLQPGRV
ncbi:MAG: hypothetical protein H6721_29555 [Sandaracinus sp.]|nr:hypothetical protein [Sandaracinus sp.]